MDDKKKEDRYSEGKRLIEQSNPIALILTIGILFALGILWICTA